MQCLELVFDIISFINFYTTLSCLFVTNAWMFDCWHLSNMYSNVSVQGELQIRLVLDG